MSDKGPKRPPRERPDAPADEPGVLGSLSSSRPSRMGRQAGGAPPKAASKSRAPKPRAVRPADPSLDRPAVTSPPPPEADERATPPSGTELLTTAFRATGELAQMGVTLAGLLVRRVLRSLPRL